ERDWLRMRPRNDTECPPSYFPRRLHGHFSLPAICRHMPNTGKNGRAALKKPYLLVNRGHLTRRVLIGDGPAAVRADPRPDAPVHAAARADPRGPAGDPDRHADLDGGRVEQHRRGRVAIRPGGTPVSRLHY